MKALYQNRLCVMLETTGDVVILLHGPDTFAVPLGSAELVVDPTDPQVAGADDAPITDGVHDPTYPRFGKGKRTKG